MKTKEKTNSGGLRALLTNRWYLLVLALIAALSFGLNFYAISKVGTGNEYYAAAVKSMTQSFHNFFYVSFDPAGMVSVDKPPLGLWIQALFVLVFGYHGWAMLLPQALAGTASCIMLYILTAKYFGRPAGLVSSLIFAVTPIVVVAARNNTMDMQLVFVLLVATWFLFKAIDRSKWRYLFLAALFVGVGFNIKMLQAYLILPAVALIYLIFAKEKVLKRFIAGIISVIIVAVVSFAWVVAVDLTPAANRPYVDSSTNNTVIELIFGHNGVERLVGQSMGGGGTGGFGNNDGMTNNGDTDGTATGSESSNSTADNAGGAAPQNGGQTGGTPPAMPSGGGNFGNGQTPPSDGQRPSGGTQPGGSGGPGGGQRTGMQGGMGGSQNSSEIGTAGVFRLWNTSLYGQASWLIILALFGIVAAVRKVNLKKLTTKQGVFVYWILWLGTTAGFFSFAGFFHRYYLCMMAPAIAALSGIGLTLMVRAFKENLRFRRFLLPLSLTATMAVEISFVWRYSALRSWLIPVMAVTGAAALALMAVHLFRPQKPLRIAASVLLMVSMLAAPVYWAITPVMVVPNTTMPYAGPELLSQGGGSGMRQSGGVGGSSSGAASTQASSLEKYLVSHYKSGSYLVVSQRANDVAQFIIDTGLPAVAYGGFLGSDNSMTVTQLKKLVAEGKVAYFLVSSQGGGNTNSDLISYVKQNATLIDASEYGESSGSSSLYCFK